MMQAVACHILLIMLGMNFLSFVLNHEAMLDFIQSTSIFMIFVIHSDDYITVIDLQMVNHLYIYL